MSGDHTLPHRNGENGDSPNSQESTTTPVRCDVCASTDVEALLPPAITGRGETLCRNCGTVFMSCPMSSSDRDEYWGNLYSELSDDDFRSFDQKYVERYRQIASAICDAWTVQDRGQLKTLDVGAFTGAFSEILGKEISSRSGGGDTVLHVGAVEPGSRAVEFGNLTHPSVDLTEGRFELLEADDGSLEMITFVNVIYRMTDIRQQVDRALRMLSKHGRLAIVIIFPFGTHEKEIARKRANVDLAGWFTSGQPMEYYFQQASFEYLVGGAGVIEYKQFLGEQLGWLYMVSRSRGEDNSERLTAGTESMDARGAIDALTSYSSTVAAAQLSDLATRMRGESLNLVCDQVTSEAVRTAIELAFAEHSVRVIEMPVGTVDGVDRSMFDRLIPTRVTLLATVRDDVAELTSRLTALGMEVVETLPRDRKLPYETVLRDGKKIYWYSHVPRQHLERSSLVRRLARRTIPVGLRRRILTFSGR